MHRQQSFLLHDLASTKMELNVDYAGRMAFMTLAQTSKASHLEAISIIRKLLKKISEGTPAFNPSAFVTKSCTSTSSSIVAKGNNGEHRETASAQFALLLLSPRLCFHLTHHSHLNLQRKTPARTSLHEKRPRKSMVRFSSACSPQANHLP